MRHALAAALVLATAQVAVAQTRLYDPVDAPARATAAAVLSYGVAASKSDGDVGVERLRAAVATRNSPVAMEGGQCAHRSESV